MASAPQKVTLSIALGMFEPPALAPVAQAAYAPEPQVSVEPPMAVRTPQAFAS